MIQDSQSNSLRAGIARGAASMLLGWTLMAAMTGVVEAQGELGNGTVSGSGTGPYNYALSFGNGAGATSSIGSVWYAWIPGAFYLPGTPTSASAPAGWSATVSGRSVQYVASSAAFYIAPGSSLSGFGYQAAFSPAQLLAAPNSGDSVAYSAGLFSDLGQTFTVQLVPEPSTSVLLVGAASGFWLACRRRLKRAKRQG